MIKKKVSWAVRMLHNEIWSLSRPFKQYEVVDWEFIYVMLKSSKYVVQNIVILYFIQLGLNLYLSQFGENLSYDNFTSKIPWQGPGAEQKCRSTPQGLAISIWDEVK